MSDTGPEHRQHDDHERAIAPHVRALIEHKAIESVGAQTIKDALVFMSDQIDARNKLLEELLHSTPITRFGDSWMDRVRGVLASYDQPVWNKVESNTYTQGIRVIATTDNLILGDCYFGYGPLVVGRMHEEGYPERQQKLCWRYSRDSEQVEPHLLPNAWRALPTGPVWADAYKQPSA